MFSLLRTRTFLTITLCAALCALLFVIQKTDALDHLRIFSSARPVYGGFFVIAGWALWWVWRHGNTTLTRVFAVTQAFLPAACIVALAPFFTETHIAQVVTIAVGFFICIWGLLLIGIHHTRAQRITAPLPSVHPPAPLVSWQWFVLGAAMVISAWYAFYNLHNAFYVDERLWVYKRIESYWNNIAERDWVNTRPSDKPGITTALVTGPGLLFYDPSDFDAGRNHKDLLPRMLFSLRAPQVFVIFCMIVGAFFLARHIVGTRTALLFVIFLAFSPLLLGISRIINPDALLWIFFILGFLCVISYLHTERARGIYAAGIFLGLALLTKYIANIFILFFLLLLFADLALRHHGTRDTALCAHRVRTRAIHGAAMVWIALCVFYVLYPGAWVRHDRILLATVYSEAFVSTWPFFAALCALVAADLVLLRARVTCAILAVVRRGRTAIARVIYGVCGVAVTIVVVNALTGMPLFDMMAIIGSPKSSYTLASPGAFFLTSFYPLIFGVTPLVLIGTLVAYVRRAIRPQWHTPDRIVLYSATFILIYYVASLLNHVAPIIRYQIIIYPLIILAAAIGWNDIITLARFRRTMTIAVLGIMIVIGGVQLASITPFYFSYNSPLLPKTYTINTKDMGDGNYEIAQWLNARPQAATLTVWTDKMGVCQFFVGTCINMDNDALIPYIPHIDYYVVSQNRRGFFQRTADANRTADPAYSLHLDRLYADDLPTVYTLHPNNRPANFIRIIDGHTVSILSNTQSL